MASHNRLKACLQPLRVNEELPEQRQLQPLPLTELARRLCHLFAEGYGQYKHLAACLQPLRVNEEFPELQQLQPLPLTELARRLCHAYAKGGREPPEADLRGREPVAGELLGELAGYLYLADQSYEGATEAQLSRRLQRKGAVLGFTYLGFGELLARLAESCRCPCH